MLELEGEKGSKTFFRVLKGQNMQIQTIFELHTDDYKSKYYKDILKSKYLMNTSIFVRRNIFR